MKYNYYSLDEVPKNELRRFFSGLFGWAPKFEVRVLKDYEYDRIHGQKEAACLMTSVHQGNYSSKNLLLRAKSVKRVIFIRRLGEGICLESIMHEMLHIYFPQADEEIIVQAEAVFETAFLCYESCILVNKDAIFP